MGGRCAGLTIIEVLATAIILGIGLVGVGSMVTYATISHKRAANYTIAAARASKELERVREAGYLGAAITPALFPEDQYTLEGDELAWFNVDDLENGRGAVIIYQDPEADETNPDTGEPYSNLKRVYVWISWGGNRFLHGTYLAMTMIANRP